MEKIIDVALMQKQEKEFINNNLKTSISLMGNAALGVFNTVDWKDNICVVCGKGNNGGDGYALSLLLLNANYNVDVVVFDNTVTDTSKFYLEQLKEKKANIITYSSNYSFKKYSVIVDAIFGIGFKGEVKSPYKEAINDINDSEAYIVSIDINSGLNAQNGLCKIAIKSNITIAINNYKPGHFINMAKDFIQELKVIDINIPTSSDSFLFEEKDASLYLKDRMNFTNKGSFGRVAIMGGSASYPGAVKLASLGQNALYSGAGLAKVIVPDIIADKLYPYVLEATITKIKSNGETFSFDNNEIDNALKGIDALAIGVGLNKSLDTKKVIQYILDNYNIPVVIDADGINNLVDIGLDHLNTTNCKVILTPHIKEFSRLINIPVDDIFNNTIEYVRDFVNKYNVTLLLKGPTTIVADSNNIYYINRGCPGMATAGSGDVLTGVICGLLGYVDASTTIIASLGAFINGYAGELAMK